jgi:hypothetical protein
MTREPYAGWDVDPLTVEADPEPPRRFGCSVFALVLLVLVAGVPTSSEARTLLPPQAESGLRGVPASQTGNGPSAVPMVRGAAASQSGVRMAEVGTPNPTGAASSIYSASATWCAPTPTQCQGWGGNARLAAVNSFRYGDEPYWVRLWRGDIYVDVTVVSFCACRGTLHAIDLSPSAFKVLAPLSRGRIDVAVEVLVDLPPDEADDRMRDEVRDPLPATSTEDD